MTLWSGEPRYQREREAHLDWVKKHRVLGFSSGTTKRYLPASVLKARFDDEAHVSSLLAEQDVSHYFAKDIAENYAAVFATLLEIDRASYIEHFKTKDLDDTHLPLTDRDAFPQGNDFFDAFAEAQWTFCVKPLKPKFKKSFDQRAILPFTRDVKEVGEGVSALVYIIDVNREYDLLVSPFSARSWFVSNSGRDVLDPRLSKRIALRTHEMTISLKAMHFEILATILLSFDFSEISNKMTNITASWNMRMAGL